MSVDNTIVRSGREDDLPAERPSFDLPPEIVARYEIREVQSLDGGERRVGLFLPPNRENPAIEIAGDRITARNEDPETVASLVKIAQHNGWDRIDVEGSAEFRKAMWSAASREGIAVSGYEPAFSEREAMDEGHRDASARQELQAAERSAREQQPEAEQESAPDHQSAKTVGLHREREELAELFLHGGTEKLAHDPRLAGAVQAQAAMEQHIGEVFDGDPSHMASAKLESRQMISDVLRRGLDVSVREPTAVRQIEPIQTRPDLER
ncbi:hypothetical protein D3Y57_00765 (plasmid) [Sphingomonas paeninsulae]|uniref:Large polyvalent protein-associated domain-containing protein n=1 Tax=Sphingomonas paeninsulae TaxID=2319844 RepID=A0A494THL9_SPHPE|nr:LPD7 domain-containing protein [Sphingomonas paeninsulae]AYJ84665.1 hypothetical protein D3Y57_00765 [Sphingomonas paeninsulae]